MAMELMSGWERKQHWEDCMGSSGFCEEADKKGGGRTGRIRGAGPGGFHWLLILAEFSVMAVFHFLLLCNDLPPS